MREFVQQMTQGTPQKALLRTAAYFVPKTKQIKAFHKRCSPQHR
jgi:hypothetical protein